MLRKIRLYGKLAKFIGHRVLEAEVQNAAEAIRFLLANWPEVEAHMADQYYKISAGDWEIEEKELHYPTGSSDIKIIPVVGGAGSNTTKIILGVVIIGAAIAFGPAGAGFMGLGGGWGGGVGAGLLGTSASSMLGYVGSYLVLGTIADMLTPMPEMPDSVDDPQKSFSFSGTQNTSRAGVPVPIIYGQVITGSIVVSAAIDTVQVEV